MNFNFLIWEQGWQTAGWTMVIFLALGTLVVLLAAPLRWLLRSADPTFRYATSLAVFAVLALLPIGIGLWLSQTPINELPLTQPVPAPMPQVIDLAHTPLEVDAAAAPLQAPIELPPSEPTENVTAWTVAQAVEYFPWVWLIGTPLTFLLLATGLIGAERLRRASQIVATGPIHEATERLRIAMGMGRRVTVAVCDRLVSPLVVGIVRPLILLPPAALTGWSVDELEMVLLHELAHIRRWDNLVNLLQRVVESLLFFHPAVWIASRWVRRDREDCCDAVVVVRTAKPQAYAELLVALASPSQPIAGLAMARHPLAGRIRRILHLEDETMLVSRNTLVAISTALLAIVLTVSCYNPRETEAEEATGSLATEVTESTEEDDSAKDYATAFRTLEELSQRVRQLRAEGKKIALKLNDYDTIVVAAQGEAPPETLNKDAAEKLLMKLLFEPSAFNPVTTKDYRVPEDFRQYPNLLAHVFEGLEKDPYGPQIQFTWKFRNDGRNVRISAPQKGQWFLQQIFAAVEKRRQDSTTASRVGPGATDTPSLFPTLEEQRAVDRAYKMLRVELETLSAEDLARVKAQGYPGGLRVAALSFPFGSEGGQLVGTGDLLVGLHVWPTPTLEAVSEILSREDLSRLSPLKFYVIRKELRGVRNKQGNESDVIDKLVTGRIQVNQISRNQKDNAAPIPTPKPDVLQPGDTVFVNVAGTIPEFPIQGEYRIESTGTIALGPTYGRVNIAGHSLLEAEKLVKAHLAEFLTDPEVQITLVEEHGQPTPQQPDSATLLYDGKTFDEWRTLWKTELKTENRTECIRALAAFGRAGKGKEAAEAILEIVKEYDWRFIGDGSLGSLQKTAMEAMGGSAWGRSTGARAIPTDGWLPVLTKEIRAGDKQVIMFAKYILPAAWYEAHRAADEEAVHRMNQALKYMGPSDALVLWQFLVRTDSMMTDWGSPQSENETRERKLNMAAADFVREITGSDEAAIEELERILSLPTSTPFSGDRKGLKQRAKLILEHLQQRQEQ